METRLCTRADFYLLAGLVGVFLIAGVTSAQIPGRNVNMVSGTEWPGGDPFLQRQNEPSIAVSSRNSLHLLAGANDYRTVDLPGLLGEKVTGDAWLGVFKSFDGGQTWQSTLLPGYPQDGTAQGLASPIKGFQAGADPTVRAGSNGLFFYSGIVFNRGENQPGAVFVARFIDLNNKEGASFKVIDNRDPVKYVSTVVVDTGNAGQFLDKPWLAVDIPRPGAAACTIPPLPDGPELDAPVITQEPFAAGNVYLAYSIFVGNENNIRTKIMFARSTNCGATWSKPIKISEGYPINQGVTVGIDPGTGTVYVAWRQFATSNQAHSIVIAKSTDGGQTFSKGTPVVPSIVPFDQPTLPNPTVTGFRGFRTSSFPTLALDGSGRVYLGWSERRMDSPGADAGSGTPGDARVVVSTSLDGVTWSTPTVIDNSPTRGHQIMPSLAFLGGKLMLVYYDLREDLSPPVLLSPSVIVDPLAVVQPPPPQFIHTIDVRVAQANPSPNPMFTEYAPSPPHPNPSKQVSRYLFCVSCLPGSPPNTLLQVQYNPPNLPLFGQGQLPFAGDYIDLAGQGIVPVPNPGWQFNTTPSNSTVFHAVWTDNRDVRPPADGNWANYTPPNGGVAAPSIFMPGEFQPACDPSAIGGSVRTGMRNQNIYTSRITQGLVVASPGNTKPLLDPNGELIQRAFVILVQNTTKLEKTDRLTILNQPPGGQASFLQFSLLTTLDVTVPALSSVVRTVFVTSSDPDASVTVQVTEIDTAGGTPVPGGLQGSVILNPDILNPDILNPDILSPDILNPDILSFEVHNPDILSPDILSPDILSPDILSPDILNPDILSPDILSPDILSPDILSPDILNPDILNPDILSPDILSVAATGELTDVTWTVRNVGNTTSAYTFKPLLASAPPGGFKFQLLIFREYRTPALDGCNLVEQVHHELLADIRNPDILNPDILSPDILSSSSATFSLAPDEKAKVTLRIVDPVAGDAEVIDPTTVEAVVVAQAVNTADAEAGITQPPVASTFLLMTTTVLPLGQVGVPYSHTLQVSGATPPVTWSVVAGVLPPGVFLNSSTGEISGTPTAAGTFAFTVQVVDSSMPAQIATRDLSITIAPAVLAATNLFFVTQPSNTVGGQTISPAVSVQALDNTAAVIPGLSITMAIGTNACASSTLSGTLVKTTDASGVATFDNLSLDRGGLGYTLMASVTGMPAISTTSASFNIEGFCPTGSMANVRSDHTATLLPSGKVLNAGGFDAGGPIATAELYDPTTETFSSQCDVTPGPIGSMVFPRLTHTATLLPNGKVLLTGGHSSGDAITKTAELYDPATCTFTQTGDMAVPRSFHQAVLLPSGKVFITGGAAPEIVAEIYDPGTGLFTQTAGSMNVPRLFHTTTLLPNGKVLIAGGQVDGVAINSAELFNPADESFTLINSLQQARAVHAARLLPNGKVLLVGGRSSVSPLVVLANAELFDPATNTFTLTAGSLATARFTADRAAVLPNGKLLIAGGVGQFSPEFGVTIAAPEVYDPSSDTFSPTGPMLQARGLHTLTLLPNGKVLLSGGLGGADASTAELFQPLDPPFSIASFEATGSLGTGRGQHQSTLLPNGKVLVTGGLSGVTALTSAELYDSVTGTFTPTGNLTVPRRLFTGTLLPNGKVLIAGGFDGTSAVASAELYDPGIGTFTPTGSMGTARVNSHGNAFAEREGPDCWRSKPVQYSSRER